MSRFSLSRLKTSLLLAGLAASLTVSAFGQTDSTATVQQAWMLIQQQNYDQAVQALSTITEREPKNAQAWVFLGLAHRSRGEYDQALDAYSSALAFDEVAPQATYNIGLTHALKEQPDEAFSWLFKAQETGQVNLTKIALSPAAEHLQDDPRYAELFPTEDEFADPFVEPVEIIHEWRGEAPRDAFGWIARNIGDVDGDGVNDVTTSASRNGDEGQQSGRVYVYSGRTGTLLWTQNGEAGAQLGYSLEAAGDVNADGIPDVIAGAPGAGQTYVYSGSDGTPLLTFEAEGPNDRFGNGVSDLGDVDGDGHDDVLVGAPGREAGTAYVYSGRGGSILLTLSGEDAGDRFGSAVAGHHDDQHTFLVVGAPDAGPEDGGRTYVYTDLSTDPAFVIEADDTGAQLGGMFVSVVGDIDADGVPDVYASDWSNNAKGRSTGRIYVHAGNDGRRLRTLTGEAAGDGFGIGPADAGDVNGDGHDDLVIGAWQHGGAAPSGGKVYLYSGKDGSLLRTYTGDVPGETFGFDATGMGDVDGDGTIDLLLTSAWSAVNGARSGRVYILSGGSSQQAP